MFTWDKIWEVASPFVKMALILLIGHMIIVYALKAVNKGFTKSSVDQSLAKFLSKAIRIVLYVVLAISALNAIGVSTSGIIAAFSAAAVAVAVAVKDSLSNVAGGILLLVCPRFVTGDYIETEGDEGTVLTVDLLHTTILTADNRQVSIPNGVLINSHIVNYSRESSRRVEVTLPIAYEASVEAAKAVALQVILEHPLVLDTPEPFVRVGTYGDSAVNLVIRVWCQTDDYWTVYHDLIEQVRVAFEENGISIPYNQLEVRIKEQI